MRVRGLYKALDGGWQDHPPTSPCEACGLPVRQLASAKRRFCSHQCAYKSHRGAGNPHWKAEELERECPKCRTTFRTFRKEQTYCSRDCYFNAIRWRTPEYKAAVAYQNCRTRSARKRAVVELFGHHTQDEWLSLLKKHDGCCAKCGSDKEIQRDHIIPLSRGGTDLIENIQPLCAPCNRKKWAKL